MLFKPKWKTEYEATTKRFGLNLDDYKTEEAFERAFRQIITKKKEEKFTLTEENAQYVEQAMEMAKELLPCVVDTRGWPREKLKEHILAHVRKREEFYNFCLGHKLDPDKILAMAEREAK